MVDLLFGANKVILITGQLAYPTVDFILICGSELAPVKVSISAMWVSGVIRELTKDLCHTSYPSSRVRKRIGILP